MVEDPPNRILGLRGRAPHEDLLVQIELTEEDYDKMVKVLGDHHDSNLSLQERDNALSQIVGNAIKREFSMVGKLIF